MYNPIAMTDLSTLLRPQAAGKTVNSHVVKSVRERGPDFAAMKRAIQGNQVREPEKRQGQNERAKPERAK
jgi:hypothetical protein